MSTAEDHKRKRTRSPAYPAFGLEDCISKAQALYDAEDRHPMPPEVAAGHWNYKASSSGAAQAISSLKQFGLLLEDPESGSRQLRLSPEALVILLHEPDSVERLRGIKAAALSPKIHRELWDKYGGRLGSDSALRIYLTLNREAGVFNKDSVDDFIKQFRDTIAFAKLTVSDKIEDDELGTGSESEDLDLVDHTKANKGVSAVLPPKSENAVIRDFPIPLMSGGLAVVKVPVPMSQSDFDQITGTLNAWKAALVRQPTEQANVARTTPDGRSIRHVDIRTDDEDDPADQE